MFDLMPWRRREGKDMVRFKNELDNLFNRFFDLDFPISREFFKEGSWVPRVDLSEGKEEITVKAEIPGCDAKDIDVSLEGRILIIKGEKKPEKQEKEQNLHRVERSHGYFSRTMELPAEVDPEKVDASYMKGVLKLVFKKTKAEAGKKIEIKTS
jgi:HSP20 family protein